MGNYYLDTQKIRAAMNKLGIVSTYDLCRAMLLCGYQLAPSTAHRLLNEQKYDPRIYLVQGLSKALNIEFRAPVDDEGRPDVERIRTSMQRHGMNTLDLWREMVLLGYEGTMSSIRHLLDGRTDSPRISTIGAICEALSLPLVAPIRR